jgi:hypothetical protein
MVHSFYRRDEVISIAEFQHGFGPTAHSIPKEDGVGGNLRHFFIPKWPSAPTVTTPECREDEAIESVLHPKDEPLMVHPRSTTG